MVACWTSQPAWRQPAIKAGHRSIMNNGATMGIQKEDIDPALQRTVFHPTSFPLFKPPQPQAR